MTFFVEKETETKTVEDEEALLKDVAASVCEYENCPYEISVNLLVTDDEGIREYNKQFRGLDNPTDVLSFPLVDYEKPSDFSYVEKDPAAYLDQETGELILGDIVINADRVVSQAKEYGHSLKREFAFLLVHSFLHLFGYDHMEPEEEKEMFMRQDEVLSRMGIGRED